MEMHKIQYLTQTLGVPLKGLMERAQAKLCQKLRQGSMFKASEKEAKTQNTRQKEKASSSKQVSGRSESSGSMTTAEKAASKGILRRRKK